MDKQARKQNKVEAPWLHIQAFHHATPSCYKIVMQHCRGIPWHISLVTGIFMVYDFYDTLKIRQTYVIFISGCFEILGE